MGPVPAYLTHSIAEFYCDEGYEHDNEIATSLICKADGEWSSDVPECHETECDPELAGNFLTEMPIFFNQTGAIWIVACGAIDAATTKG